MASDTSKEEKETTILSGSEAIAARWKFIQSQGDGVSLDEYKVFSTWKHLLNDATLQDIDEMKTRLLSMCTSKPSPKKLKRTSPKKAAKLENQKRSAEKDLDEAARAQLFG
eukprot:2833665-Amphidinium_carterae.3